MINMSSSILAGSAASLLTLRPTTADRRRRLPRVMDAELFRSVSSYERKRAARSNQPSILLLVADGDQPDRASPAAWEAMIQAVAAATREPDLLGWIESRTVLGVIVSDFRVSETNAQALDARIRRALALKLDAETIRRFTIRLQIDQGPQHATAQADPPHTRRAVYLATKRALDVVASAVLLALTSPLLLLIAALVKLGSSGPVFFEQVRVGQWMKPFTMLKFRTMYVNVDETLHQQYVTWYINSSGDGKPGQTEVFKLTHDPRITPIGRLLRKTSFDELPQLWNVLRGDMSLVGPRPPIRYELEQYQPWHCRRLLDAKPGITGLWQVTGRSRTTFNEMVRLDLRYARTCSFWTDVKILLATPSAVISGKGAC
jgi:lipopolysaccharide/colanic/teichoic acid biosynthesis glycosyltransferase